MTRLLNWLRQLTTGSDPADVVSELLTRMNGHVGNSERK